ncbi:hypothetical protein CGRA01v4_14195 [Colletotrichum graminicola]|nr:hypothetical protein CGRA01v4_14195 [Colletotrichum graminicola]
MADARGRHGEKRRRRTRAHGRSDMTHSLDTDDTRAGGEGGNQACQAFRDQHCEPQYSVGAMGITRLDGRKYWHRR